MPLTSVFFEAPKVVSTKTLLLKHHYSRQGNIGNKKCAQTFLAQTFGTLPGVWDTLAKFPGHPRFPPSKPIRKISFRGRARTAKRIMRFWGGGGGDVL